ncbi:MAG: NAD(P)-dependent oxidoreductase [Desulfobacteraceae bacterium]|jgi:3-hydroxyisobutyrate dehydrogenase-like beta-hydroxyacid dehydrogenase
MERDDLPETHREGGDMSMRVAFIGMGIMGQPMSLNVLKAGHELTVYNRSVEKTGPLEEAGARVASSPKGAAEGADVIILMLTGPEAIETILEGSDGVLASIGTGKTLINMSTVPPAYSRYLYHKLEARSVVSIDAPVSGSRKPAEEGTLVILAGGPMEKVKELEPLFLTMGKKVVYCGEAGQGSSMKMAVNLLLGVMMAGLCEAVNFGQMSGLSTETMLETMLSGPMGCALFEFKKEMLISGTFVAQFPLKHMTKDVRFALQAADENGAAMPLGHALFQLYRQSVGQGLSTMDFAAVKKVLEAMSDSLSSGPRSPDSSKTVMK